MTEFARWQRKLARPATRLEVAAARTPMSSDESWFGDVRLGLPGEAWPTYQRRPMWPLVQIDCAALDRKPPLLREIAFVTVFIGGTTEWMQKSSDNGDGWCVRAYADRGALVDLPRVDHGSHISPRPLTPVAIREDFPVHHDLPADFPDSLRDSYYDCGDFPNTSGTKVGGWPTNIQSEIYWAPFNKHPAKPKYVFQVDTEPAANWTWVGDGVGYFGRGTGRARDVWTFEWQGT